MADDVQETTSEQEELASHSAIDPKIRAKVLKEEPKAQKELAKWQKEKARPKHSFYLWYLMLILTLVYIVDEVATNLNSTMQPYMIEDFFMGVEGLSKNDAQAKWDGFGALGLLMQVITIFYRPLADRFGRKVFLFFNTLIMAVGMILCFWSPYFPVYLVGYLLIVFMTGPDMQVVYVTECAPKAHRASFVSVIKGIAQLGIALIAIRDAVFHEEQRFRLAQGLPDPGDSWIRRELFSPSFSPGRPTNSSMSGLPISRRRRKRR
jgi:hypothetical protein